MSIVGLVKLASEARENKIIELQNFAEESGKKLPMTIRDIIAIEQRGDLVDLDTGEIIPNGAQDRFAVTETAVTQVPFRR